MNMFMNLNINAGVAINLKILTIAAVFSIMSIMAGVRAASAMEGEISEPAWYEASVELERPADIKKGAPGAVRFLFTPLVAGEFIVMASCRAGAGGAKSVEFAGGVKSFRASALKTASCEFEFTASKPVVEMLAVEFSVKYPAQELIKMVEAKFGARLYESKKLIKKIGAGPEIYSASLPLKMIVSDVECAVNPEIYFEKNIDDEFLNIKPVISREEATEKIRSFEAKYDGVFELSEKEFVDFIRRTGCDFFKDLNDYFKGLHAYNYSHGRDYNIDRRTGSPAKLPETSRPLKAPACDFDKVIKFVKLSVSCSSDVSGRYAGKVPGEDAGNFSNAANGKNAAAGNKNGGTKNVGKEYIMTGGPLSGAGGGMPIYMAAFYNLFFIESFKNGGGAKEKVEAIKNFESVAKLLTDDGRAGGGDGRGALFADAKVRASLEGYFLYNAGVMYKKTGAIDHKRYFEKAASKNRGLIVE